MSTRCFTIFKIYKYSILFHHFVEFITPLVISFAQCKEYVICLISLSKFSDALPSFTCAKVVDNAWSICLVVSILIRLRPNTLRSETLAPYAKPEGNFSVFIVYWSSQFFQQYQLFYLNFHFLEFIYY